MKARGSYRATYESIDDDRDWRRLSPLAKATFDTLKRRLGQYGIETVAIEALPRIVNCTPAELESALCELEAPKPGRALGWIRREEDVIWIVNGLRFEPTLFVEGDKPNQNHRIAARKHGLQLHRLTRATVVEEYLAYYNLGAPDAMGDAIPHAIPPEKGMGGGMVGGITESESESENESEIESESDARARRGRGARTVAACAAPSKSLTLKDLPPDVVEFGARFYGRAPSDRRRKIASQLLRLARGQTVRFKNGDVRAGSLERLARKCRDVLDSSDVRKSDAAIAVLLAKLADSTDLTGDQRKREEVEREEENRRNTADAESAEAWLEDNPTVVTGIDEELERQGYAAGGGDAIKRMARTWARRGLVIQAWRAAGAPVLVAQESA